MSKLPVYWEFARPFTLLMPAVGMVAGGIVAWGADPRFQSDWGSAGAGVWLRIGLGAIMAAVMNAGSNGLNQIYDIEIDRINKPTRPLPSGRLRLAQAWRVHVADPFSGFGAGLARELAVPNHGAGRGDSHGMLFGATGTHETLGAACQRHGGAPAGVSASGGGVVGGQERGHGGTVVDLRCPWGFSYWGRTRRRTSPTCRGTGPAAATPSRSGTVSAGPPS